MIGRPRDQSLHRSAAAVRALGPQGAPQHPLRTPVSGDLLHVLENVDRAREALQGVEQAAAGHTAVEKLEIGPEPLQLLQDRVAFPEATFAEKIKTCRVAFDDL